MAGGGGNKKRFQYCIDPAGQEILYLLALRGHSGRNLIDPSLQDNALIPNNFFEYIYHVGCAINLHSITNSGLIQGGQILSNRQTVFFCLRILWTKNIRILARPTWEHRVVHITCIKHGKTSKHGALGRRFQVQSNTIERNHLLRHTPSSLYPESSCDEI